MVFTETFCQNCGKYLEYESWCKPCQINDLKEIIGYWTSGNEKIDNFIQEMQLQINNYDDIVVEWISYNQFEYIKEIIGKDGSEKLHLAIWKDGPLEFDDDMITKSYIRNNNKRVVLKCSQNIINEVLNEV
jgi:hypothetical protein